jgi:uncharacterized protein
LDFIARFADTTSTDYADRYICFAKSLEASFKQPVDLLTKKMISNPYFREELEETRKIIYEERSQEVEVTSLQFTS